jgi:hypothetical protein
MQTRESMILSNGGGFVNQNVKGPGGQGFAQIQHKFDVQVVVEIGK